MGKMHFWSVVCRYAEDVCFTLRSCGEALLKSRFIEGCSWMKLNNYSLLVILQNWDTGVPRRQRLPGQTPLYSAGLSGISYSSKWCPAQLIRSCVPLCTGQLSSLFWLAVVADSPSAEFLPHPCYFIHVLPAPSRSATLGLSVWKRLLKMILCSYQAVYS